MKPELVNLICHGLECFLNASVSFTVHLTYNSDTCILIGVTVIVSNNGNYVVNETGGAVNITLMFDQPSCQSITVIARPQVRSIPDATGSTSCLTTLSMFMRTW